MSPKKKITIIGVEPQSLLNFRIELLKLLTEVGHCVTTISKIPSNEQSSALKSIGVNSEFVSFSRNGLNPVSDLKTIIEMFFIFKRIKPDIILAYTVKPIIWGGIAARLLKIDFYALVTGLGFAFHGNSFKRRLLTKLVIFLYKVALKKSKAIIFQNQDNRNFFVKNNIVDFDKTHVVNGSGVDIERYSVVKIPSTSVVFLCIARLLGEKGLREYADAARVVKSKFPHVRFDLVGLQDLSLDAILLSEVNSWKDCISYKGVVDDVRPYIENCHIYVLPSYHEGLPRSTLEAMSMGRPVITTDAVGCRETVEEGVNGFKVTVKSAEELVEKMVWFIENSKEIEWMGRSSRKIVEDRFDVRKVNRAMLKAMQIR